MDMFNQAMLIHIGSWRNYGDWVGAVPRTCLTVLSCASRSGQQSEESPESGDKHTSSPLGTAGESPGPGTGLPAFASGDPGEQEEAGLEKPQGRRGGVKWLGRWATRGGRSPQHHPTHMSLSAL